MPLVIEDMFDGTHYFIVFLVTVGGVIPAYRTALANARLDARCVPAAR